MSRNEELMEVQNETLKVACKLDADILTEVEEAKQGKEKEIALLVLLGIFVVGALLLAIFDHSTAAWFLMVVCLLAALYCAFARFMRPRMRGNTYFKQLTEICQKETYELTVTFCEKTVRCELPTGGTAEVEYKQIRSAVRTDNLIVLFTKKGFCIPIRRDPMDSFSESNILTLLSERCKKVKFKGFDPYAQLDLR